MDFKISFTNKEVIPWSVMVFLKRMLDKMGFRDMIQSCPLLPQTGSNRGYSSVDILETFILSIWCGATLRFKTFAIGAYFESVDNELHLKIALNKKRKKWFEGIWNKSTGFITPFIFSNA